MKKTFDIAKQVLTWVLIVAAVGMMIFTVISVRTFDRNDRELFGYKVFIVRSDSMNSVNGDESLGYFSAGDLIFVKEIDPSTLVVGDIISYTSTGNENFGETVTHMIKEVKVSSSGAYSFITYGTSTGTEDTTEVTSAYVLGKYAGKLPGVGTFFSFLKTPAGYVVCILLPFLLLIILQGVSSFKLFKQYKAEQMEEIDSERERERAALEAERAAIAEERRQHEEALRQLRELQAAQGIAPQAPEAAPEETEAAPEAEAETEAEAAPEAESNDTPAE